MGKWKSLIVACLGLGVATGVGFYIYRSISSEENSYTMKFQSGEEQTHTTNDDLRDAYNHKNIEVPRKTLAKMQDLCDAANRKTLNLQRDKQTEKPRGSEALHNGREDEETVGLIREIKLKCSENIDYNNESTSAENGTENGTEILTESNELNNSNENKRTTDLTSEKLTDTQVEKEHLNNTTTDMIHVGLTRDVRLKTLVNVEDLNDGRDNESSLTSEAPVAASCSPSKPEGYHRGQYWIPC